MFECAQFTMEANGNSFNEICKEYVTRVYRYMYARVGNSDLAEDLASECLLKVVENAHQLDSDRNINAWIFTIAHNTLVDYYRKVASQKDHENIAEDYEIEEERRVEDTVSNRFLMDDVLQYLSELRSIEREVIELTYFAELDANEISDVLNMGKNTIRTIRHRAIKKLRKFLN